LFCRRRRRLRRGWSGGVLVGGWIKVESGGGIRTLASEIRTLLVSTQTVLPWSLRVSRRMAPPACSATSSAPVVSRAMPRGVRRPVINTLEVYPDASFWLLVFDTPEHWAATWEIGLHAASSQAVQKVTLAMISRPMMFFQLLSPRERWESTSGSETLHVFIVWRMRGPPGFYLLVGAEVLVRTALAWRSIRHRLCSPPLPMVCNMAELAAGMIWIEIRYS